MLVQFAFLKFSTWRVKVFFLSFFLGPIPMIRPQCLQRIGLVRITLVVFGPMFVAIKSMHVLETMLMLWVAPVFFRTRPTLFRLKSITHLRTFSSNGVYVALQLFLVILVSDQWRRVLIPYSYRQAPWGLLHARSWHSRYTWDQRLYVVSEPRETHSQMLKARFLHL